MADSAAAGRHPVTGLHTRASTCMPATAATRWAAKGRRLYFVEIEGTLRLRDRFGYAALEEPDDRSRAAQMAMVAAPHPLARGSTTTPSCCLRRTCDAERPWQACARTLRDGLGRHAFTIRDEALRLRARSATRRSRTRFADAGSALDAAEQAPRAGRAHGRSASPPTNAGAHRQRASGRIRRRTHGCPRDERFELAYQPIVAVAGGDEAQYQTLLRLRQTDGTLHTAAEIMPAAETAGRIVRDRSPGAGTRARGAAPAAEREQAGAPVRLAIAALAGARRRTPTGCLQAIAERGWKARRW